MRPLSIWCVAMIALIWSDIAFAQRGRVRIPPPPPPPPPTVRIPIPTPQVMPSVVLPNADVTQDGAPAVEILAMPASPQQAAALTAVLTQRGLDPTRSTSLDFLGTTLIVFSSAGGLADERIADLTSLFAGLVLAPNGALEPAAETEPDDPRSYGPRLVGWNQQTRLCGDNLRLGMIDTGADLGHRALTDRRISQRWLVGESRDPDLLDHGTGIAALLVGAWPDQGIAGLLPNATLLSAGIFRRTDDGRITASVEHSIIALDWLGGERADVVNLSVAGAENRVLDHAVNLAAASGLPMVAAAGNGGPEGAPAYPAASAGALAVTALDPRRKAYRHATHGAYIDVAAPGVDIWTAAPAAGGAFRSGTSMATPFVAAMIGLLRLAQPTATVDVLYATVRNGAEDLGAEGHDPIFGWGLAHAPMGPDCVLRSAQDR